MPTTNPLFPEILKLGYPHEILLAHFCMMQYTILYRSRYPSYIFQTPLFIAIMIGNEMSHMFKSGAVWWPQIPYRKTHMEYGLPYHNKLSKFKRSLKRQVLAKYKLHMGRWVVSGEG